MSYQDTKDFYEEINHKDTKDTKDTKNFCNVLSREILTAAVEVHRRLGPGLLESAYEAAMCHELFLRNLAFERQKTMSVSYKGIRLDCGYRIDLLVENLVIVELKAVDVILPIHEAQLLTYLRLSDLWLGLLLNFNVPILKQGIRRMVNGDPR